MYRLFILIASFLAVPSLVLGHGGFQKQAGETTVYIIQNRVSPLVGEEVEFNFVLKQGLNSPLKTTEVELAVIDTFFGDESKDKTIFNKTLKTDENGSIDFSYTFSKENYFDVELSFADPKTQKRVTTGFLIEPRAPKTKQAALSGLLIGVLMGFFVGFFTKRH